MRAGLTEELPYGTNEVKRGRMGFDGARQDGLEARIVAVVGDGVVGVLVHDIAVEVDASEDALVAGVGQESGVGQLGGGGSGGTAHGAGCDGDVSAKFDLIGQEVIEARLGDGDQDEVGRLTAGLETEAGTGELDEGRS